MIKAFKLIADPAMAGFFIDGHPRKIANFLIETGKVLKSELLPLFGLPTSAI